MSRKNKLIEKPFKNDIGQTIKPGDTVIIVGARSGAWIGLYTGLIGRGAQVAYSSTKQVYRHRKTGKKFADQFALEGLGEKQQEYRWPERELYYAQRKRIAGYRDLHYHLVEEPCIRTRWSARRRLYKLGGFL